MMMQHFGEWPSKKNWMYFIKIVCTIMYASEQVVNIVDKEEGEIKHDESALSHTWFQSTKRN